MIHSTPDSAQELELGLLHHRQGRLAEAEAAYRRAIQIDPRNADALNNLGMLALQAGRSDLAIDYIGRAISFRSDAADIHNNLGEAFRSAGRLEDAVAAYRQALQLDRAHVGAHCNLGSVLQIQGRLAEAFASYQAALKLAPNSPETLNNLGNLYKTQGKVEQALAYYALALTLKPTSPEVHNNIGLALKDVGRVGEAIRSFREALRLQPGNPHTHSNFLLTLQYSSDCDGKTTLKESREFAKRFEQPLKASIKPHLNDRDPERRLRIGYLSPDFRRHPVASFIEPVFAGHNRNGYEVFCYYDFALEDEVTNRLKSYCSVWRDISRISDENAVDLVRRDGIDILIDLAGHTNRNRMLMLARKPAPLQMTYLGYLGTSGLEAIDYRIADWYADPAGAEEMNSERLLRLPDSLWCYRPSPYAPAVSPSPAVSNGFVTFGSLNNLAKVNREVVALWARILMHVPFSRLLVAAVSLGETAERLKVWFGEHEIAPDRLELVDRLPHELYALLPSRIDVGLDPFPFSGGTTTCEALWSGVPLVTLAGRTFAGRAGVSLLTNVGLPELIAATPDEYVDIARRLAGDLPRLTALRGSLRQRMAASPLMDESRFVRNLEAGYRRCWREWCGRTRDS